MSAGSVLTAAPASPGRLRSYAQLVRLPNVFTALADIAVGMLAVRALGLWPQGGLLAYLLLFAASACLYAGGMVWNDYFDLDQDRGERPFRPIPSGRVTPRAAARLGTLLLVGGFLCALAAGWRDGQVAWLPGALAGVLIVAILLYDRWLKRFWAGPLGMGTCRFLNVLLGFSVVGWSAVGFGAALSVGVYIVGVTWFARTEARLSSRSMLASAAVVMLAGLLLVLPLTREGTTSILFPYLLVGLGFWVGIPACQAIAQPQPKQVQSAVKRAIFGLVVLDTLIALALAGSVGILILLFLIPASYLGRWIYST
jgi:4-hydroxybenzoate polyprenyltransferase